MMLFKAPKLPALPSDEWANWPRTLSSKPAQMLSPTSTNALVDAMQGAPGPIRMVGGNHSFMPLAQTDGTLMSLDAITGVDAVDTQAQTAWIKAGTRLRDASPLLAQHGLAFKNLGDIDVQSVAGATATATHGTGAAFPCLSAEIQALRLITPQGEQIDMAADDPRLPGAKIALGSLGAVTDVQMALRPALRLHRQTWAEPIDAIIDQAHGRWAKHRNYEFYWIPFSGMGMNISHEEATDPDTPREIPNDDAAVMQLKFLRAIGRYAPWLRRKILSTVCKSHPTENVIGTGYELLASERGVPFTEMEYHLPVDQALPALRDLIAVVERDHPDVFFPIEVRMTAGDDAWLSPFQGAPRISIAVHAYHSDDHSWFYDVAEPLFRAAGGRPHWGKLHSLGAKDLDALYPDFERFCALRETLDPDGKMVTPAMAKIWGLA